MTKPDQNWVADRVNKNLKIGLQDIEDRWIKRLQKNLGQLTLMAVKYSY